MMADSRRIREEFQKYFDLEIVVDDLDKSFRTLMESLDKLANESQWVPLNWVYSWSVIPAYPVRITVHTNIDNHQPTLSQPTPFTMERYTSFLHVELFWTFVWMRPWSTGLTTIIYVTSTFFESRESFGLVEGSCAIIDILTRVSFRSIQNTADIWQWVGQYICIFNREITQ